MTIKFIRFNKEVKIPNRAHHSDTGADIYMPCDGEISPGETVVIPLGFGIDVPNGHSARMQVRTSIAKKGIMIQGCAIDAGYRGEISMILHNISNQKFTWEKDSRLGYLEMYPVQYPIFVDEDLTERGTGAFGSTGK